jgi:hypothetical protein
VPRRRSRGRGSERDDARGLHLIWVGPPAHAVCGTTNSTGASVLGLPAFREWSVRE